MEDREYELRVAELKQNKWEAEYNAKGEIEAQGFKGLVIINGGAAVALGALLQALVTKIEAATFIPYILTGIIFNIVGVTVGSVIFWVRYNQGIYEKKHNKFFWDNPWWPWRWYLGSFSVACFVVGMGIVAWGGFTQLNPAHSPADKVEPISSPSSKMPSNPTLKRDCAKSGAAL